MYRTQDEQRDSMTLPISSDAAAPLAGRRILVVEDEVAISMLLEDMLMDLGAQVVGPASRVAGALDIIAAESLDLAILDVNVGGQPIYPVAEALDAKGVRYLFSTGYGSNGIAEPYRDRIILQKPFTEKDLEKMVLRALA